MVYWTLADAAANDLLRSLMQQASYPYVWRKLNRARWHLIEHHAWDDGLAVIRTPPAAKLVLNGDVYPGGEKGETRD
jgi:hypothetical protein